MSKKNSSSTSVKKNHYGGCIDIPPVAADHAYNKPHPDVIDKYDLVQAPVGKTSKQLYS